MKCLTKAVIRFTTLPTQSFFPRFIVHDVTKVKSTQLEQTSDILIQSLQLHPQNQIHVVLTHTDMLNADVIEGHKKMVKEKLEAAIDQEVQNLSSFDLTDEKERHLLSRQLQQQKKGMKYFLVSNKTYEGVNALKDFLMALIAQKRISIPEKWVQFYKAILKQEGEFLKVKDLKFIFEQLYSTWNQQFQKAKLTKKFQSALRHFRNSGLIMYFDNISGLDEYVFQKKTFLINLFKSCFHHDLMSTIDFANLGQLLSFKRSQVEYMVMQYQTEGILSAELLQYLWHKYGIDEKLQKAVLDIMKMFHLCHPINSADNLYYFPWFTKNNECPDRINPEKLTRCDQYYFSVVLNCLFICGIPANCFEVILVHIQKLAWEHQYSDDRYTWRDGLEVKVGSLECVAVRIPQKATISIRVQGERTEIDEVWEVMSIVYSDLESYLKKLEGVIEKISFTCNHCVIKDLHPYHEMRPTEVFKKHILDLRHTTCRKDKIPVALVHATAGTVYFCCYFGQTIL